TSFSRDWSSDVCSSDLGSGDIPAPVPAPSHGSLEAELADLPHTTSVLRLPAHVDARRLRMVGPHYDPGDDARHAMVGDPTAWFIAEERRGGKGDICLAG